MRALAVPIKRAQFASALLLGVASLVWADKVQEVSADFLEYLGSLEGEDDNWTDFTAEAIASRQGNAKAAASASSSSAGSAKSADSSKGSANEMSKVGK